MNKSARVVTTRAAATAAVAAATALVMMGNVVSAAPVGPINPVQATQGFLVMTEGNANLIGTENEGTLAVGGNLVFSQYQLATVSAGNFFAPGENNPTALVVDGQVDFVNSQPATRLQVLQNGYAKIGNLNDTFVRDFDNNNVPANTRILPANDYDASPRIELVTNQSVPSVGPVSVIDFAEAFQTFRSNSTELATCQNTVVLRDPNGDPISSPIPPGTNAVINLSANTTNVLNINSTDLDNIGILTFADQPTASSPLLVNVSTTDVGDTFAWTAPNFAGIGGPEARFILFNFPTATALTLAPGGATVEGTIYAPRADFTDLDQSNTEGSIIARTLEHRGGEIHDYPFSTTLACDSSSPTASPTATPTATPTGTPTADPTMTPTVTPSPTGTGLPITGSSSGSMLFTGSLAVLTGTALLLTLGLTHRRRRNAGS
ncbi:choice-of-anchor A family protein [Salinispora oceanensis]|uniref:choice-of-anchor A family protein n=1 Tax=Salinispora oceanensis TaxID=1050199 RepID=UPI0003A67910|nr:choice-of-anchor A family protein [Salinispora oceanensis]